MAAESAPSSSVVFREADGGVDATPPVAPPPIVTRILRACASCKTQEEEKRAEPLALSQPGDPLEREADHVADRVMRAADPAVDRAPPVSRVARARDDEEAAVARAAGSGATSAGAAPLVRDTLRSSGQPLSGSTRAFMEPRFGRDFGDVRIHTDAQASRSAEAVSALAYTVGSNIVFRSGQYAPETHTGARLLAHELTHVVQQAPSAPIQRATAGDAADGGDAMAGAKPAPAGLIVEDDESQPLDPKQMRKSAFLAALRPRVDEVVDAGYSGIVDRITGRAVVAARFAMYGAQSAKSLEQTLHREVGGAGSAAGYMGAVVARVRAEVAADEAEKKKAKAVEKAKGSGIFFKSHEGGALAPDDPRSVKTALGHGGQPLPSRVRAGMESAMGQDFSGVRVHTGATAQKLSSDFNARAFTVGHDIAFDAGQYQPGTPVGDALIAHELAHVVQQGNAPDAAVAPKSDGAHDGPLEKAADESAMGAVLSLWGGVKTGALELARKAGSTLKTGLKLQRCGAGAKPKAPEPGTQPQPGASAKPGASADPSAGKPGAEAPAEAEPEPQLEGCPKPVINVTFQRKTVKIDAKGLSDLSRKTTQKIGSGGHTKFIKPPTFRNTCPKENSRNKTDPTVGSVEITATGAYTIPVPGKVTPEPGRPKEHMDREQASIDEYFRVIEEHEQNHVAIYMAAFNEIPPVLIGKAMSEAKTLFDGRVCRACKDQASLDKASGCVQVHGITVTEEPGATCGNYVDCTNVCP